MIAVGLSCGRERIAHKQWCCLMVIYGLVCIQSMITTIEMKPSLPTTDEKEHHIQLREVNNSTCVHRVGNHEVFKTQPKSVLSEEGSVAFFPCEIQEKSNNYLVPIWRFNGETLHLSSDLPSNYIYNGSGLVVSPVKLDFNGSTYECCTFCRNNSGMLIESNKGMLTVSTKTSHSSHDILSFSVLILTVVIVFLLN